MASDSCSSESSLKEVCKLRDNFRAHKMEITNCLNYEALGPSLCESNGLFTIQEVLSLLAKPQDKMKSMGLLHQRLEEDLLLYQTFLDCLKRETTHLGHEYITALVEGREYASTSDVTQCALLRDAVHKRLTEFTRGVNLIELVPQLTQSQLLTVAESNMLCDSQQTVNTRVLSLVSLLDSKGPFGYSRFVECLKQERDHCAHSQLYEAICDELHNDSQPKLNRRKRGKCHMEATTLCKRLPQQLKLHGVLAGSKYKMMMVTFQSYHHNGEWIKLGAEAEYYSKKPGIQVELQIVALLESAISKLLQRQENEIFNLVSKAQEMCKSVEGDNSIFLEGRCLYIQSRWHRYQKNHTKARELAQQAMIKLYGTESGEDSAFANYCYACALLEESPAGDGKGTTIKDHLERAIRATSCSNGLDLVGPHACMRMAQMYLGSTQYSAGSTATPVEDIRAAESCLANVNVEDLPARSQCCLDMIRSDLYYKKEMFAESKLAVKRALDVALQRNYTNDIESATNRLSALSCH